MRYVPSESRCYGSMYFYILICVVHDDDMMMYTGGLSVRPSIVCILYFVFDTIMPTGRLVGCSHVVV